MDLIKSIFVSIFLVLFIGGVGATPFEYFNVSGDGPTMVTQQYQTGQTFTVGTIGANEDVALTSIRVKMKKVGSGMGSMMINLYNVDAGGLPTGMPISFTVLAEADIPTVSTWTEIIMAPSGVLSASTQYALTFDTQGDGSNFIELDLLTTGGYPGGENIYSTDWGTSWDHGAPMDILFEAYGTPHGTSHEYVLTGGGADLPMDVFVDNSVGQIFTVGTTGVNENFTVSALKMFASSIGGPPSVDVAIRAVTAGLPSGPDLSTGKISGFVLSGTPAWVDVVITPYELQASTEYAITFSSTEGDFSNHVTLWGNDGANYPGGTAIIASVPPDVWSVFSGVDLFFEVYGEGAGDITPPTTSITSVAGDTTPPYDDEVDDHATTAIIAGEADMVCRWDTSDLTYANMSPSNNCSIVGSDATCAFGDIVEGNGYLRYVSCEDSLGNGQSTDQNLDITFDVIINDPPTLTSVSALPDPVKGGNTVTVTPTGQGDDNSVDLYYYCGSTTTPTSVNTDCSEGNAPYASPYAGMTCTYASPTDDVEHTVYCRTYDGESYSSVQSTTYTTDSTAPSTSITSIGGDLSSPYVDVTGDNMTDAVISGEANMVCRWATTDLTYANMANDCSVVGSDATCSFGDLVNDSYTRYVSCNDSLGNAQTTGNNLDLSFDVTVNFSPTLTSVSALPDPVKGGNTVTVTPTGQGDDNSDTIYYYCGSTTTPTSANTDCSEGNAPYTSPYAGMTCTYASPTDDVEHTVYCRTYDGNTYSSAQSTTFTTDSTPPSTSITSIGGDLSSPYVDVTGDNTTDAVISGEANMVCRWATTDLTYVNMVNSCSVVGSDATCSFGDLVNDSYTRYVSCNDSLGNAQTTDNNLDLSFDVTVNFGPTLTSVSALPDPVKGGNTVTVTPTGQGDDNSDTLYYYCGSSINPTSANTDCSEGNAPYASPYAGMTCTYASPTDDVEHTVYCRTYDGAIYSSTQSTSFTSDSTAPSTSITSIGEDLSSPYVDAVDDSLTGIVIAGESNMVCRWGATDLTYANMGNDCSIVGSDATCNVVGLGQGNYTRYVSCNDSLGNAQTTGNNLDVSFEIDWNDVPVIGSVVSTLGTITQGDDVNFTITWTDLDSGENVKAHVCKENGIIGQECVGGAWVEDSGFGSVSPIELTYTSTIDDSGLSLFYVFVCDDDNLCSVVSSGSFTMESTHSPTYVGSDIALIVVDALGEILVAFVSLATIVGLVLLVTWGRAWLH